MDTSHVASAAPLISAIATGLVGVVGLARGTGRVRTRLKSDVEILASLPPGPARDRWLAHVEATVDRLVEDETDKTRDWPMLIPAMLVAPGLAALTAWLILEGGWWQYLLAVPTGLLGLIFVYGIFETGQKAKRDGRGFRTDEQ
ncbi:MAG: hypothetical protein JWO76_1973 [Nocardioides sp.]|nr:hypothetical protein [Nocardioides sp.]